MVSGRGKAVARGHTVCWGTEKREIATSIAAAQHGAHPGGRHTYGHSLIVDPWGTVIAEASDGVGLVSATLERARLEAVRRSLPSLLHRKLGLVRSAG